MSLLLVALFFISLRERLRCSEREEDLSQDGSYRKLSSIPDSKSRSFEDSHNQESKVQLFFPQI